jgi:aquaporin Z
MDRNLRMYLADLVGTFLLVLVGAGTVCAAELTRTPPLDVTGIALAEGMALAVALSVSAHVSPGCLNPAVTLMLWVFKRIDSVQAACLIGVQVLGAALAGLVLWLTFTPDVLRVAHGGAPHLKAFLGEGEAVHVGHLISGTAVELFLTFLVTLAVFAALFDRRGLRPLEPASRPPESGRLGGLVVGATQAAAVLFGFRLTGGSANPARWLGPALWQIAVPDAARPNWLAETLIYVGGPVLGALLAAALYVNVILPPEKWAELHQ